MNAVRDDSFSCSCGSLLPSLLEFPPFTLDFFQQAAPNFSSLLVIMVSSLKIELEQRAVVYFSFTLVVQTFFFGGYTVLMLLSTRISLKRGLKTGTTKALFFMGLFMYILSAAHWAYSIAYVICRMQVYINPNTLQFYYSPITKPFNLFNALILVNRWNRCVEGMDNLLSRLSQIPIPPIVFLILTTLSISATILLRIMNVVELESGFWQEHVFVEVINTLQVSNVGMSLISNLSATGVIGATAWRHRQQIKAAFRKQSKGDRILILLVESGVLYCLSGITVVVSMLIRLPHGTLGDIYTPINTQIAGVYAPVVLLLVQNQTLHETDFLGTISGSPRSRNVQFAGSVGPNRTVLSTIHFAANLGPQRNSFESGASSESDQDEFEKNREQKKEIGLGPRGHPEIEDHDVGIV
ncbi:hypothetical protein B0H13DRAFT_2337245 [Mycena leptocephala]|nr:hypothetical protein B0H13DRAFT_2337245 [Mycena leptocephala]